jgi:hypothetical protein
VAQQRTEVAVGQVRAGMADLGRQEAGCQQKGIAASGKALVGCSRLKALVFGDGHEAAACEHAGSGVLAKAVEPGDRGQARPRTYGLRVCLQICHFPLARKPLTSNVCVRRLPDLPAIGGSPATLRSYSPRILRVDSFTP